MGKRLQSNLAPQENETVWEFSHLESAKYFTRLLGTVTLHYVTKMFPFDWEAVMGPSLGLDSMAHLGRNFMLIKLLFNYSCKTCAYNTISRCRTWLSAWARWRGEHWSSFDPIKPREITLVSGFSRLYAMSSTLEDHQTQQNKQDINTEQSFVKLWTHYGRVCCALDAIARWSEYNKWGDYDVNARHGQKTAEMSCVPRIRIS